MMNSNETQAPNEVPHEANYRRRCGGGCRFFWKFPLIFLLIVAVKSALVMLLWNALIPELFHGPVVDYLQAVGLVVLAKLLVGGFRHHHHGHRHFGGHWRHKWANLSEEERQKLREEFRKMT